MNTLPQITAEEVATICAAAMEELLRQAPMMAERYVPRTGELLSIVAEKTLGLEAKELGALMTKYPEEFSVRGNTRAEEIALIVNTAARIMADR